LISFSVFSQRPFQVWLLMVPGGVIMTTESEQNEYIQQRHNNLEKMSELGFTPWQGNWKRDGRLADLRASFREDAPVAAAGRLMTIRKMGKAAFADIHDGTDRFQLFVQRDAIGEDAFKAFKLLDIGDIIGVKGSFFITKTGEQTIKLEEWAILSKALRPLPDKWSGLKDVDARYRQRYLDLISDQDVRERFNKRIAVIKEVRSYLSEKGFLEVETPMMQPLHGGAAAKPFKTHYEALHSDMFLRIAPELYLKRLLVGGFDKVFELNRNFRNEGLDRTHNPEFTMLEIYEAFGDLQGMKDLIQGLITHVAQTVFGTLKVGTDERPIDLTPPWREVTYRDLVIERMGRDWYDLSLDEASAKASEAGLDIDPAWDHALITHEVYEKLIEDTLIQPTFVTRLPAFLVPLAQACPDDPDVVDVFELEIGGQEIAPAYQELNNPIEQRRRFSEQAGEEAHKMDDDFLTALEHGMPPAGGMGVGIDRLIMILTGTDAIRDVILFPQLRPRTD
jgi:lysyl-tRNA synthetase class 2